MLGDVLCLLPNFKVHLHQRLRVGARATVYTVPYNRGQAVRTHAEMSGPESQETTSSSVALGGLLLGFASVSSSAKQRD